jgi:hypothetical protein
MALAPDGDVTEQARAVRRIAGERQGLTEEQIETLAKSFDAKAEAEMTLAAEHREEPAEWQHRAVSIAWDEAAALLRAERSALAPGDVAIPRAILEKLAKAADPTFSDAREARWAAERILQRAPLAAEPARTDPEAARRLAEARAGLAEDPAHPLAWLPAEERQRIVAAAEKARKDWCNPWRTPRASHPQTCPYRRDALNVCTCGHSVYCLTIAREISALAKSQRTEEKKS